MKRTTILYVTASITVALYLSSCTKIDTTDLGTELIPAVDNVSTFETILDVITDNKLFDDTTRMLYGEKHAVGLIENDLEFGATSATLYASFTPAAYRTYPFTNRDSVVIDSVVLSLSFTSLFGDSNSVQQFDVREIDPVYPFPDSTYMLGSPDLPVLPDPVGSRTFSFLTLNDSVWHKDGIDTVRTINELRIPLDTSWARRFVNYDTSNAYLDDTTFKQNFRGLEIRSNAASPLKNALAYFDLDDNARTRITFYCRVENNGKTDTVAPYFTYVDNPHANIIRRTPANGYLANLNNAVDNDEKLYIQAAPGSYATVKIPGLDTLNNRVIHRAELIMERYPSSDDDIYAPPSPLFIDAINETGDSTFTIRNDFVSISSSPGYDAVTLGGQFRDEGYIFNLSRYVQTIVTKGYPSYTLRVYAPFTTRPFYIPQNAIKPADTRFLLVNTPVANGRVVVYGGGSTDPKRMRLRIIYSKL